MTSRGPLLWLAHRMPAYAQWLLVVVLLANFKGLPFVWNIRLVSSILRHCVLAFKPGPTSRPKDLYAPCMYNLGPCLPADLDFNLHKSDSTDPIDLDFARLELVFEKFRRVLTNSTHFARTYVPLGSLSLHFIKAISPGEQVSIESRILPYGYLSCRDSSIDVVVS